jgi:tape measure domain-containing protein
VSVVANVAINVDSRGATQKLREVQSQAQQTERAFGGVTAAAGKLAAAFGVIQAAKFVFAKTAEIETQTRSLQVLTGSAEKAGQIIKELQQLGAVTPFTSTELIDSAKRLQAFGVEADKVVETTRRLADVSGATGAELQGLVTAYGQVQAKGRLQGEELLQFQERGVALQEELRKMYGLSGDEFQKALSKGRIGAEAVEVAITRLTNAGGKYANGAIAQSDTLAGKFSTLQDGIESLARDIGTKLAPALKNVLNLAIGAVNAIGNVLAGGFAKQAMQLRTALVLPGNTVDDLKKILALTQGISTQGLGASGIQQVANEIKTNQVAVANVLSNINASRPFGVTQQEQSLAEAIQAASQQKVQQLQNALDTLKKSQKQTQAPTGVPALLAEDGKAKAGRQLSVDDLLGGDIQRKLREAQARLQVATQANLNVAAQQPNAEQAQRIVEATSKLLNIKYQIDAIDKTITGREQVRAQIIASSKDKTYAALAFDEQTTDLKSARVNLEREIDQILLEQLGKAEAQYRQEQQAIKDALSGLDMEVIKLQAKGDAGEAAIKYLEIENQLKAKGITLTDLDAEAIRRKIAEIQKLTKEQKAAQDQAKFIEQQFAAIGAGIGDLLTNAFDNLINKTKDWNDILRDSLMAVGRLLMMAGLNMLAGTDGKGVLSFLGFGGGFGTRAAGGPVTGGKPYIVGERGPELFLPSTGGNVMSNNDLRSAMGSSSAAAGAPVLNMSFQTTNIGGVEYVSRDQLEQAMAATRRQAASDGAKRGMTMTLDKLQQSPGTRSRVGLR